MVQKTPWEPAVWPFDSRPEVVNQFDCYNCRFRGGTLYLRVSKAVGEGQIRYKYTSSYGASSDRSFSGCLPPECNSLSLTEAQDAVVSEVAHMNRYRANR